MSRPGLAEGKGATPGRKVSRPGISSVEDFAQELTQDDQRDRSTPSHGSRRSRPASSLVTSPYVFGHNTLDRAIEGFSSSSPTASGSNSRGSALRPGNGAPTQGWPASHIQKNSGQDGKKLTFTTERGRQSSHRGLPDSVANDQPQHRNASNHTSGQSRRRRDDSSANDSPVVIDVDDSDEESSDEAKASTSRTSGRHASTSPTAQRAKHLASIGDNHRLESAVGLKRKKSAESLGEGPSVKLQKENAVFASRHGDPLTPDDSVDELDFLGPSTRESVKATSIGPLPIAGQGVASRMAPNKFKNHHLGAINSLQGSLANASRREATAESIRKVSGGSGREIEFDLEYFCVGDVGAVLSSEKPVIKYLHARKDFRIQWTSSDGPHVISIAVSDLDRIELANQDAQHKPVIHVFLNAVGESTRNVKAEFPEWDAKSSRADLTCLAKSEDLHHYTSFRTWIKSACTERQSFSFLPMGAIRSILELCQKPLARKEKTDDYARAQSGAEFAISPGLLARRKARPFIKDNVEITISPKQRDTAKLATLSSTSFSPTNSASTRPKPRPIVSAVPSRRETRSTSGTSPFNMPFKTGATATTPQERRMRPVRTTDALKLRYPFDGPGSVSVFESDCDRLEEGEFLNDTLVEFGLKYYMSKIQDRDLELYQSMYVFNTFLYRQLTKVRGKQDAGYQQVRKWTAKANIFEKKYLVIPINENLHWYLAIVVNPGKALDFIKEEETEMSDSDVGVQTRHARSGSRKLSPEESNRNREGSFARSECLSTPELPSEKVKKDAENENDDSDAPLNQSVVELDLLSEEVGVEDSYSQMSIRGRSRTRDVSHPQDESSLEISRDLIGTDGEGGSGVVQMDEDKPRGDFTTPLPGSPSSSSAPSEPEPIVPHRSRLPMSGPDSQEFRGAAYVPTQLSNTTFLPPFLGLGDDHPIAKADGDKGDAVISAAGNAPMATKHEKASVIDISDDDEDTDEVKDMLMHDVAASSNIHNKGRGTVFGGGPLSPTFGTGRPSMSPPMPSGGQPKKEPVRIIPGESWLNHNASRTPSRPLGGGVGSGGAAASTSNFYGTGSSSRPTLNLRSPPTYAKGGTPGKRILSAHNEDSTPDPLPISSSDDNADAAPSSDASQEPFLPGRSKGKLSTTKSSTIKDDYDVAKGRAQRIPSAAALANISKRRQQLEGLVVLTFDSLSGRHPAVQTAVKNYLRNEAWDKKSLRIDPQPAYIDVNVPGQSNWCDCGLFVLLYFDRFFSNPSLFIEKIIPERDDEADAWQAESANQARKNLRNLIDSFSIEWLQRKKKAEEEAKASGLVGEHGQGEEDSQSDVEVVPLLELQSEKEKGKGKTEEEGEGEGDKEEGKDAAFKADGDVHSGGGTEKGKETKEDDKLPAVPPGLKGEAEEEEGGGGGEHKKRSTDEDSLEAHPSTSPVRVEV